MDLQVCHCCGWTKVTTYQGLRIHQGKMGCTPKGVRVAEPQQKYSWGYVGHANTQIDLKLDVRTSFKIEETTQYSNLSLQVCHCGWSKLTTYQGLRIHQGKMGCTPKGARIPKKEQYDWKNQRDEMDHWKHLPPKKEIVKKENFPDPPSMYSCASAGATAIFKEEYKLTASGHAQQSSQRAKNHQLQELPTLPQVSRPARKPSAPPYPENMYTQKEKKMKQPALSQMEDSGAMAGYLYTDYAAPAIKIKEEPKSPLSTARSSYQRTSSHQPQESSAAVAVQQSVRAPPTPPPVEAAVLPMNRKNRREQIQVTGPVREPSAPLYPSNVVRPKKKKIKQQTLSQMEDRSAMAGYLSVDCYTDSAEPATKIKEMPKSPLANPRSSFQRTSSHQPQESSTPVAVQQSVRAPPTPPPVEAAVLPMKKKRRSQTQVTEPPREPSTPPYPGNTHTQKEKTVEQPALSQGTKSAHDHPPSPPPVPPKKNSALFKEMLERSKTELQPRVQMMEGKTCEIRPAETDCRPKSVPDLTNTNSQTGSAAADVSPKENPTLLNEAAEAEGSTGMKVKELARRFSTTTASETVIPPKEKHKAHQKLSQNSAEPAQISSCADSTASAIIREGCKSPTSAFAQRSSQRANNSKSDHQVQEFSTVSQVTGPSTEPSAPPYPGNMHTQKEKTVEQPTLSQTEDSSAMAGYLSTEQSADCATTATKMKEKPKSPLTTPQPSFQGAASSQQQEFSSGVQVKGPVREAPSTLQLEAAVMPKETNREDQTQLMSLASDHPAAALPEAAGQVEEKQRENPTFPQGTKSAHDHPPSPPPVPLKKNSALFKEMLERSKTELQPRVQMMEGKTCEIRPAETDCRPESVPDLTNTNSQTGSAAADVSPKENPTLLNEAAEAEGSTGMKNSAEPAQISSCADSTASAIIREGCKSPTSAFAQRSSQRANNSKSDHQVQEFSTVSQVTGPSTEPSAPPYPGNMHTQKEKTVEQPTLSQTEDSSAMAGYLSTEQSADCATTATKMKEKPKSPLTTPQPSFQGAASSQQQEFSSGVQVKGPVREAPSTLQLEAAVMPKETNREDQTQLMSLASDHPAAALPEAAGQVEEKQRENPTFPQGTKSAHDHPPSPPPVPPKKNSALFKEMLERSKTELQPRVQMMEGKTCEIRPAETDCRPKSVPDLTNSNSQTGSAAADVSPKENPTLLNEAAEAEGSTGMKVKELARRFSTTTASETVIPPKEKHKAHQKLSQVKLLTQRFSAISAQETAAGAKAKLREEQKRSQMLTDSTRDVTKINSAATRATLEKGPELSCENAQFSSGLKVKDLARMFSASATQENAIEPKEKQREEQKPEQRVKLLVQKISARGSKDHHNEKDEEDQKPSKWM